MKVEELSINRGGPYSSEKHLRGGITLVDANGAKIEVPLTPGAISRLVACISSEVVETLRTTANAVPRALQQAQDEGMLLEHDGEVGENI